MARYWRQWLLLGASLLSLIWLAFIAFITLLMSLWGETGGGREEHVKETYCTAFAALIAVILGSIVHFLVLNRVRRGRELIAWTVIGLGLLVPIVLFIIECYKMQELMGPHPIF
jgi:membrane protease YdiL (CAAX protease family)